ncbi:uncharacterized protein LOC120002076 [Tripterygium wilfordii]|uniref:uncharacterized protein LOC120002076 n=1 Tax=Tripterygium wilfordii TaxID=458696 RepID=UPI0018F8324F|nr:uncharacterized protein LOC120002076 [Tripterygium wilfordii]
MSPIPHSSASSLSRSYEICLVCEAESGIRDSRYEVFVVDVGPCSGGGRRRRGSRVLRNPLFHIPKNYPMSMCFFAFDSSIYFAGGFFAEGDKLHSSDVYVYDTSSSDRAIKKLSSMNSTKFMPLVIGPINDKFYVISGSLLFRDFERFDPKLDSWVHLSQPPVQDPVLDAGFQYATITAYAVVNNDREILLYTKDDLYSYHTDSDEWFFYANASIPPTYYARQIGCVVSIGGDRYLGFKRCGDVCDPNFESNHRRCDDDHIVLGTYRYDSSDHTWHDFQYIHDWPLQMYCHAYPMSLGDGLLAAVVSGYDRRAPLVPDDDDDDDESMLPSTHYVSTGLFVDGPNFNPLHTCLYKEEYNMKRHRREISAAFPLFRWSNRLES